MKVTVLAMVVAVLVSSTVKCDEASEELCEQIRSNKLRILTMGARGRSLDDAHFYILVEGGYMFKVPLVNLRVDAENKATSITIDREYIRADALFKVSRDLFTRQNRFFLISNQNQDAFLGRMFYSHRKDSQDFLTFQLFNLNAAPPIRNHSQDIDVKYYQPIHVMSSIGIDSNTTYGFALVDNLFIWRYIFETDYENELKLTEHNSGWEKPIMEFSSTTDIVAVFYHQENPKKEDGYYYFLDAKGLVTVCPRQNVWNYSNEQFEVNLSRFVVCDFKKATNSPGIDSTYWIIALCIGAFVGLGGVAIYFYCSLKKEKAKRKDLKKKYDRQNMSNLSSSSFVSSNLGSSNLNSSSISSGTSSSNASSNAFTLTSNPTTSSSSMASKGSSILQSVKSSITSLLNRNKSKQAKTAAKAKNSKAKEKKPKSPK